MAGRFFVQCRTQERQGREEKIYKNLKSGKNRRKVTYGCGIVKEIEGENIRY